MTESIQWRVSTEFSMWSNAASNVSAGKQKKKEKEKRVHTLKEKEILYIEYQFFIPFLRLLHCSAQSSWNVEYRNRYASRSRKATIIFRIVDEERK